MFTSVNLFVPVSFHYSKTLLTQTSADHPRTSVLTEVRVVRKLNKIKATVHLIMHTVNTMPVIIIIILYYAMRQQSTNIQNNSIHKVIVMSIVTV